MANCPITPKDFLGTETGTRLKELCGNDVVKFNAISLIPSISDITPSVTLSSVLITPPPDISLLSRIFSAVFKIYLYDMILRNPSFKQMLTKDVEKKKRFTTSADASDNLYHPIAFGRDELI